MKQIKVEKIKLLLANSILCDRFFMYFPFYLSEHWLLAEQLFIEMSCFQS